MNRVTPPNGFWCVEEVITAEEERVLAAKIRDLKLHAVVLRGVPSKRRIKHFGVGYSFENRAITEAEPIPDWLKPSLARAAALIQQPPETIEEALVTEYQPGASIRWHRDASPFHKIVGLSLLAGTTIKLRKFDDHKETVKIFLPPRSAYVLDQEARSDWEHSIPAVLKLRYSITFRTMNRPR